MLQSGVNSDKGKLSDFCTTIHFPFFQSFFKLNSLCDLACFKAYQGIWQLNINLTFSMYRILAILKKISNMIYS